MSMKAFMKRKIINIAVIILSAVCMIFATSCFGLFLDTDGGDAESNMVNLLKCLQKEDRSAIKSLFAPNKIADIEDFDEDIDDLLNYYNGKYLSYGSGGIGAFKDSNYGDIVKYYDMSYDVTTTEDIYRFHLIWYIQDTTDADNVGIWSLSIIRFDDDPDPESSYRGDGSWTSGINIGKISVLYYLENIIECLQSGTPVELKSLFAPNKINGIETIDSDIEDLFAFFVGEYQGRGWDSPILYSSANESGIINYYDMSFFVITSVTQYRLAIRWCVEDTADPDNLGIWSLYITECEEDGRKEPYWGDGLWTNGVNIVYVSDN